MTDRRKLWTLGGLAVVVILFLGDRGYRKLIEEPNRRAEQLETQLDKRLKDTRLKLAKAKQAVEAMEQFELQSLPWDSEVARARYQAWLIELARNAGLSGTSVDSGEPVAVTRSSRSNKRPVEMYTRYAFSVRGRGDLGQVTQFMYDFYRSDQLHKIRSFALAPQGEGQMVDVSFSIEALSLPLTERESELTTAVSDQLALADSQSYRLIATRNLFGAGGANWAWSQVLLTAITSDARGVGQAWFAAGKDQETRIVRVGGVLELPSLTIKLVSVRDRSAVVEVEQQQYLILIGQRLSEAALQVAVVPPSVP